MKRWPASKATTFPEDPELLIRDARKYKRQYPDEKRDDDKKKRRGGEGQG